MAEKDRYEDFDQAPHGSNFYRRGSYDSSDQMNRRFDDDDSINRGYSSFGGNRENPARYRRSNTYGDLYEGNFSGSNYDRDLDFKDRRPGYRSDYGSYGRVGYIPDRSYHPDDLGVRSNYFYNRAGYGTHFGGEYGHFPDAQRVAHPRDQWPYGNPYREYTSFMGRSGPRESHRWKHDNRDWVDRTRDEIASWFGDDEAEYRRRVDRWEGQHRGRGPRNYKRADSRIEEDVNDRLSDDSWIDATQLEVKVENGNVILSGEAIDRFSKKYAEDLAERVSGVRNVENRIHIRQEYPEASPE